MLNAKILDLKVFTYMLEPSEIAARRLFYRKPCGRR